MARGLYRPPRPPKLKARAPPGNKRLDTKQRHQWSKEMGGTVGGLNGGGGPVAAQRRVEARSRAAAGDACVLRGRGAPRTALTNPLHTLTQPQGGRRGPKAGGGGWEAACCSYVSCNSLPVSPTVRWGV